MTTLVRRNPFDELASLWPRDLFSRWTGDTSAFQWDPRCDMTESGGEIVVHAELPGVKPEDVEVTLRDNVLQVRGEKRTEHKEEEKGRTYSERFFGTFERVLTLPMPVDEANIKATMKDGVLEIHLPKMTPATSEPKKIEVVPAGNQ